MMTSTTSKAKSIVALVREKQFEMMAQMLLDEQPQWTRDEFELFMLALSDDLELNPLPARYVPEEVERFGVRHFGTVDEIYGGDPRKLVEVLLQKIGFATVLRTIGDIDFGKQHASVEISGVAHVVVSSGEVELALVSMTFHALKRQPIISSDRIHNLAVSVDVQHCGETERMASGVIGMRKHGGVESYKSVSML